MTYNEARERAKLIWHNDPHHIWSPDMNGRWIIQLQPEDYAHGVLHKLDANGHTDCHPECAKLELQLVVATMGRASRGKLMYKSVYVDEPFAQQFHDAICELMNAHPEWYGTDIDVDWEEYKTGEDE